MQHQNRNDPSRPLTFMTYTINYCLFGPSPWHFRLFNMLIHYLTFLVLHSLLRRQSFRSVRDSCPDLCALESNDKEATHITDLQKFRTIRTIYISTRRGRHREPPLPLRAAQRLHRHLHLRPIGPSRRALLHPRTPRLSQGHAAAAVAVTGVDPCRRKEARRCCRRLRRHQQQHHLSSDDCAVSETVGVGAGL
jgi:hypothetical protein